METALVPGRPVPGARDRPQLRPRRLARDHRPVHQPKGKVTLEDVKRLLDERLHLVPPFTSRLAKVPFDLDWPYWVPDDHFDLGYHVRELALPEPGSMAQLTEQTARIYSRRLDRSRPLWELYLIHGLSGGRAALVTKIHHAAVDGMSGSEILTLLYDLTPEPREVEPPAATGPASGAAPGAALVLKGIARCLAGRSPPPGGSAACSPRRRRPVAARRAGHRDASRTLSAARRTLGRQPGRARSSRGPATARRAGPTGGGSRRTGSSGCARSR